MKIDFEVDKGSIKNLQAHLDRATFLFIKNSREAVRQEVDEIMEESQAQVPFDTGTLAQSAFIEEDTAGNITFGYGGPNDSINPKTGQKSSEYMMVVHERLDVFHPTGKAKFFEDPLLKHIMRMEQTVTGKIRKLIGGL